MGRSGLNLINVGPISGATGYAEINRSLILELYRMGVNIKLKPKALGVSHVELEPEIRSLFEGMVLNSSFERAPVLFTYIAEFFEKSPQDYTIGLTMLECDRIPARWVGKCNAMDEVWVPSHFNREVFVGSGVRADKVRVMPLGVDEARFTPAAEPLEIPGKRGFTFLSVFEWTPRKGYDLLIRAYLEEFGPGDDVCLVLKVQDNSAPDLGAWRIQAEVEGMKRDLGKANGPPIIILSRILPRGQMPSLYRAADCFVLPTRGEGWNMPAIEAMACGLPVISTKWSGHLEFMNPDNSYLLEIEGLEPIPLLGTVNDRIYAGARWAKPNFEHLRALLRYVYEHREEARGVGMRASREVRTGYSWRRAAQRAYRRLEELHKG